MSTPVKIFLLSMILLCWSVGLSSADTVVLKDGTKLVGAVMKSGDRLWVEPDNGTKARFVDAADVKDWIKGGPASSATQASVPTVSGAYGVAKAKADALIYPNDAIKVWKEFLAAKVPPSDLDKRSAQAQIADLTKLQDSGSERLAGKWISGVERK